MGFSGILDALEEKDKRISELEDLLHIILLHIDYEPSTKDKLGYIYFKGNKNAKRSHLIDREEEVIKKFLG